MVASAEGGEVVEVRFAVVAEPVVEVVEAPVAAPVKGKGKK
jgi:hypothetical protein